MGMALHAATEIVPWRRLRWVACMVGLPSFGAIAFWIDSETLLYPTVGRITTLLTDLRPLLWMPRTCGFCHEEHKESSKPAGGTAGRRSEHFRDPRLARLAFSPANT